MEAIAPERPAFSRQVYLGLSGLLGLALAAVPFLRESVGASMVTQVGVILVIVLAWMDLTTGRVPNAVVYPAILFVLAGTALVSVDHLPEAGLGAAANLGAMFLLALVGRGAMGMGDVKFAAVTGSLLGWPVGLFALALGFAIGAGLAIVLLLLRVRSLKDSVPLTPFLALAAVATGLLAGFVL